MKWIIYQHINKINGKRYIGQTSQNEERRWRHGDGYVDSPKFYRAIQKYGWDNFSHEIIEIGESQQWANERERYWISYYDTFNNDEKGYNMTPGGENYMKELWQNEEYKNKMRKSFSEARQRDWSNQQFAQDRLDALLNGLNKAWSNPEWKEQRVANMMGDKNSNAKAVKNLETGKIFTTIKEASLWAGLKSVSSIGQCCRGKQNSAGKHPETGESLHWVFINKEVG